MNFMTWAVDAASAALDSVDSQATEKVGEIKKEIEKGAPVNLATATKILGIERHTATTTVKPATGESRPADSPTRDRSSPLPRDQPTSSASPEPLTLASADPASSAISTSSSSSSSAFSIVGRSSPARSSRTLASAPPHSAGRGEKGLTHSASATSLPKHGKEPSAKAQAASTAVAAAARDEELLGLLNSSSPLPPAPPRSGSPAPGGPQAMGLSASRSPSPVQRTRELNSSNASPPPAAAAARPLASSSSSSSIHSASGNFLSSLMQRVSPSNSPATGTRKIATTAASKTEPAVTGASTPAQSFTSAFAAVANSASALASSVSASNLHASSSSSNSTNNAASADLQAENARLAAASVELQGEVASLKQVWHDSRGQITKLKGLLENAKEMYAQKLREADAERERQMKLERDQWRQDLDKKEREHAKALEEAKRATAGSTNELGLQSAQLTKVRLDHARELAQRDQEQHELTEALEADRKKLIEREAELLDARVKLETQAADHLKQLTTLHEETLQREQRAEESRRAHSQRLEGFEERGHQLELNTDEYITLIASLQRQLEAAQREVDAIKADQRMGQLKAQGEAEGLELAQARFDAAERAHAQALTALQARLAGATTKNESWQQAAHEWRTTEEQLRAHILQLETDLAASRTAESEAAAHEAATRSQEDEQRMQSMAAHLLTKSQALERATAERTSLRLQLENETTRVTNLEIQLRAWREKYRALETGGMMSSAAAANHEEDYDPEHGSSTSSSSSTTVAPTRRGGVLARSPKLSGYGAEGAHLTGLQSGNAVAKAVGFVDSMGQQVSILLRRYPQVRIGFGVYVLIIHLYVAFVFVHLMHEFGGETHHGATTGGQPTMPAGMTRNHAP